MGGSIFLHLLLLLSLGLIVMGQRTCPPPQITSPCSCKGFFMEFYCHSIPRDFNLKGVFDNVSRYVDADVISYSFGIAGTGLRQIEEDALAHLKFHGAYIQGNPNLTYISPLAFGASRNVSSWLEINDNGIGNEPPNEGDIYHVVSGFEKLEYLDLSRNRLSSIPALAFQNLSHLTWLSLAENQISRIGNRAFAIIQSENLTQVDLSYNLLPSGGLPEDAFEGILSNRTIFDLRCNKHLSYLEEGTYKSLVEKAVTVKLADGECAGADVEPFYECDERSSWICDGEDQYRGKLEGFRCMPGTGFADIWEYCTGRK